MIAAQLPKNLFTPRHFPSLIFRQVQKQDKKTLHAACYAERPFLDFTDHFKQMLSWQVNGRCCWLVVCQPLGTIVGSGQLVCYPNNAELANLSVVASQRGQGIGTAMIEILTAVARHSDIAHLELSVRHDNPQAKKLYQQLGFTLDRQLKAPPADVLRRKL